MEFNATSTNMTELLVVALVILSAIFLMRKRYDSNLPLLAYFAVIVFTNAAEGRSLNPFLLYTGVGLALTVRFEFMGAGFAKFIGYLATGSLCVITWVMVSDVFSGT
jgi:hypothetical protein